MSDYFTKTAKYVWGIGLSRTGTTSLAQALRILGYKTIHYLPYFDSIQGFNAATDITILLWLKTLDEKYPGLKFVWTERDIESWLTSVEKHIVKKDLACPKPNRRVLEIRQLVYGCTGFNEELYRLAYQQHLAKVDEYFHN